MTPEGDSPGGHITRRRLLGAGAAGGLAVAGFGVGRATAPDPPDPEQSVVSFEGRIRPGSSPRPRTGFTSRPLT